MSKEEMAKGLGTRLFLWSICSSIVGVILYFSFTGILQGVGLQAMLWGIIDLLIAVFTLTKKNDQSIEKLTRILYINIILDVLYQIIGIVVIILFFQEAFVLGNGFGVVIQGAFLFFLDLHYYRKFQNL